MSPGTRFEEVEPAELLYVVSPSESPGPPDGVADYRQHYPRPPHGSVRSHPVVWWREVSLVPGSPKESDKPGPQLEITGGLHPTLERTGAVCDLGQQTHQKPTYL